MHRLSSTFLCLLSLMLTVGCEVKNPQKKSAEPEATHGASTALPIAVEEVNKPAVLVREPVVDRPPTVILPPPPPLVYDPIYTDNRRQGTCEHGTSDCDDQNPCTIDSCEDDVCVGTAKVCPVLDATCQVGICDGAGDCQEISFSGPYGEDCTTPYPGVCSVGAVMCVDGKLTTMCEPLVRPGDKLGTCNDEIDNDCDGDTYECACPVPLDTSIRRYVNPLLGVDTANDCIDVNNPCKLISHAIGQSLSGDTVLLSAGVFLETNIIVDKNVFIEGYGPVISIVDADGTNRVFTVNAGVNASFCGMTITGGVTAMAGGGFLNLGTATIAQSVISGNSGGDGGGIFTSGSVLTITDSTISDNLSSGQGGGLHNASSNVTISNSTISGNSVSPNGGGGGGILNANALFITNSTISGNAAATQGVGGGINTFNTATIANSTITGNSQGGLAAFGAVQIGHTIVANQLSGPDCVGAFTNNGFNLDKDGSCLGFTHVANFSLPALANNGGPTQTHALDPVGTSVAAIDSGNTTCGVTTDQRGEPRPVDYPGIGPVGQVRCDIGAFEIQAP